MIYTHVLNKPGIGVKSPFDRVKGFASRGLGEEEGSVREEGSYGNPEVSRVKGFASRGFVEEAPVKGYASRGSIGVESPMDAP
jgi:hypothetical protein